MRIAIRVEEDVLDGVHCLPHRVALAVYGRDGVALADGLQLADVGQDDANARRAHPLHGPVAVQHPHHPSRRVGRVRPHFAAVPELLGRLEVLLGAGAEVSGVRRQAAVTPSSSRFLVAHELQIARVPVGQRRRVDDLQRDRVRHLLVVRLALEHSSQRALVLADLDRLVRHLVSRVHRREEHFVGVAAVARLHAHRVVFARPELAVVVAGVQLHKRAVVGQHRFERLHAERRLAQVGRVVIAARHLGHQLVQQAVVDHAVRPRVRVERVELEARRATLGQRTQRVAARHPHRHVVDEPKAVEWQPLSDRVTHDAVVPLPHYRRAVLVGANHAGGQKGEVLVVVLRARVRTVVYLIVQILEAIRLYMVSVAVVRLFHRLLAGVRPRAFQIAEHRLEVVVVLSLRVVLRLPRLEPLTHLGDGVVEVLLVEHGLRHGGERDVLRQAVRRVVDARHHEAEVVVARAELDPVQHGDHFAHADRAHVVGVVVDGGDAVAGEAVSVVRLRAHLLDADLFDARRAV